MMTVTSEMYRGDAHVGTLQLDDCDAWYLDRCRWAVQVKAHTAYARTYTRDGSVVMMHRMIARAGIGQWVDHINGDGLDNRRCNLRLCTPSQNNMNRRRVRKGAASVFKGVTWKRDKRRWKATIYFDGKRKDLGTFKSELQAARAYDAAVPTYHGVFGVTNFP